MRPTGGRRMPGGESGPRTRPSAGLQAMEWGIGEQLLCGKAEASQRAAATKAGQA
jgi:hypothetical protein